MSLSWVAASRTSEPFQIVERNDAGDRHPVPSQNETRSVLGHALDGLDEPAAADDVTDGHRF
jgi:hypothetical protein